MFVLVETLKVILVCLSGTLTGTLTPLKPEKRCIVPLVRNPRATSTSTSLPQSSQCQLPQRSWSLSGRPRRGKGEVLSGSSKWEKFGVFGFSHRKIYIYSVPLSLLFS
ncbi:hypothetical protein BT69DRAFT_209652 [Atractiella rhizophila]|nr:hypothetical protein BT69DRAFT_209652 [Atractiella rhizophila]